MAKANMFLELLEKSSVIVMISSIFLDKLRKGIIKITDFSFIVLDECHHAKGDHPYNNIMREFYFPARKKMDPEKMKKSNNGSL